MLWIALLPRRTTPSATEAIPVAYDLRALAWWALQFSPRVAQHEGMVLLEAGASERLFGGRRALLQRLSQECVAFGVKALAVAPTARAAQALAGQLPACDDTDEAPRRVFCTPRALGATLDALPLDAVAGVRAHAHTLQRLGCTVLADVRRLPRGGLARRFPGLLDALDGAYGLVPEAFEWVSLPERFDVRLEFLGRIDVATGLMFGANRLLLQLKAWLAARQRGAGGVVLHWEHDLQRRGEAGAGRLEVRTGAASRDTEHMGRLLAEHLARQVLAAPVVAIRLEAIGIEPLAQASASLLPDDGPHGERFEQLLERLAARLGPDKVLAGSLCADHRPERMQSWAPAGVPRLHRTAATPPALLAEAPPWVLREPLPLAVVDHRPMYQGPLDLLDGPQRVEAGWWGGDGDQDLSALAARDYFVARSAHAGLLWIYRVRGQAGAEPEGWFLHGVYG